MTPNTTGKGTFPQSAGPKRTYEKPAIIYEQKLEAVAAACTPFPLGKAPGVCFLAFS